MPVTFGVLVTFQSTHPARGATVSTQDLFASLAISIHAPRERCDERQTLRKAGYLYFNPRTPREVRQIHYCHSVKTKSFQSTHPARGATPEFPRRRFPRSNFNPRTPREVRLARLRPFRRSAHFNPRTPREVRQVRSSVVSVSVQFQSTHPARGATLYIVHMESHSAYGADNNNK